MTIGSLETIAATDPIEDIVNKTFYGFRVDTTSGKLYLECLTGDTPITLPKTDTQTEVGIAKGQYVQWFWSKSLVKLYWGDNATNWKNRLLMKVL
jgi:hypothetical protein